MTRAQYEATYGIKPVISTSTLDTTPAPIRMTRKEYDNIYGDKTDTRNVVSRTVSDIPSDFVEMGKGIIDTVSRSGKSVNQSLTQDGLTLAQRGVGALASLASAPVNVAGEVAMGAMKSLTTDEFEKTVSSKLSEVGQKVKDSSFGKSVANFYNSLPEDQKFTLTNIIAPTANVLSSAPALGVGKKVVDATTKGIDAITPPIKAKLSEVAQSFTPEARNNKSITRVTSEIAKVEDKYAPIRKANTYSKDVQGSRARIAQSNVLENAVDENGLLQTGDAIKAYKSQTIDGVEDVVRKNLENEGKTVNLNELRNEMKIALSQSGLEASDLLKALKGVENEIKGLSIRADAFSDVPLVKIQDAKIGTTNNINFQTPPETATYRKTIARVYKQVIENKSDLDVKEVNAELSKYYGDIERLERLNGRRVEGGRLGKYTAALAGTAIGMGAGSVGGGFGAAVGGLIGGEVGALIRGKSMAGTFRKGVRGDVPENPILQNAKARSETGKITDLKTPSSKVGAGKGIPKTKDIQKLEGQIAKNVDAQKIAIKAGNFDLVKELKDVYELLVVKLKDLIREYKTLSPKDKNGGFIKNPLVRDEMSNYKTSNPRGRNLSEEARQALTKSDIDPASAEVLNEYLRTTSGGGITRTEVATAIDVANGKTPLPKTKSASTASESIAKGTPIQQEAKQAIAKGMTEDEFVKSQGDTVFHGTNAKFDTFDFSKKGSAQGFNEPGIFFTSKAGSAKTYNPDFVLKPRYKMSDAEKTLNDNVAVKEVVIKQSDFKPLMIELQNAYEKGTIKTKPITQIGGEGFVRPTSYFDNNRKAIKELIKNTEIKGLRFTSEGETIYMAADNSVIKTTSQLRAEYQAALKANGKRPDATSK